MLCKSFIVLLTVFQLIIPFSYEQVPVLNSFSSKTAYRNSDLVELENSHQNLVGCNLVHVNTIYRHGTRYPWKKDMTKISQIFSKINKSVSRASLPKEFLQWKNSFSLDQEMELDRVGMQEMSDLGKRFRVKFDTIIGNGSVLDRIKVFSTSINRSKTSALFFLESFLGKSRPANDIKDFIKIDDDHLRFYDTCPMYSNAVLKDATMQNEYQLFLNGPQIKDVIDDIQKKWGLQDVPLDGSDVKNLFIMCGYEIATNRSMSMIQNSQEQTSPLCSLFSKQHFAVLEYLFDLKHYWMKAYGKPISKLIGCKLMSRIVNQIQDVVREHEKSSTKLTNSVLWFSHAETILPMVALLGLFDQKIPMTANGFVQRLKSINHENRFSIFRAANIVPFSANLGLDLYHCGNNLSYRTGGYRIQLRINEKAVPWPATGGLSHISLSEFQKRVQICDLKNFNFEKDCQLKSGNAEYLKTLFSCVFSSLAFLWFLHTF